MTNSLKPRLLMAACFSLAGAGSAQEPGEAAGGRAERHDPRATVTRHQVSIGGSPIRYTATAGWLILEKEGAAAARFGYTAYTRDGIENLANRPITFAFNGGPGSASIWLRMGVLGPRRVVVTEEGFTPPPPSLRVDNAFSILDVSDLVMLDPVGTGFSIPLGKATGNDF